MATTHLAGGALDIGLVDGMAAPSDPLRLPGLWPLTTRIIAESPLVVALPDDHPLAQRTGLRLADLADARWIDAPDAAVPLDQLRVLDGQGGYRAGLRFEGFNLDEIGHPAAIQVPSPPIRCDFSTQAPRGCTPWCRG